MRSHDASRCGPLAPRQALTQTIQCGSRHNRPVPKSCERPFGVDTVVRGQLLIPPSNYNCLHAHCGFASPRGKYVAGSWAVRPLRDGHRRERGRRPQGQNATYESTAQSEASPPSALTLALSNHLSADTQLNDSPARGRSATRPAGCSWMPARESSPLPGHSSP